MIGRFTAVRRILGLDPAVRYSVAGKVWLMIAGVINVIAIGTFCTEAEQGYLYTFQSLLAFQVLFDMSLATVLAQFAAHEMSGLRWNSDGSVVGGAAEKGRLASIIRLAAKWYTTAAVAMIAVLTAGGVAFFTSQGGDDIEIEWIGPWIFLVAVASSSLLVGPLLGILEGCGKVAEVAKWRLLQEAVSSIIFWIGLSLGLGLYSLPIYFLSRVIFSAVYLVLFQATFFADLWRHQSPMASVDFKHEVWPFQWRFIVSSLSSLLAYSLIVPIVFATQGAVVSGKLGMTFSVTNAIVIVSMVWMTTKVPHFCDLIARREYEQLANNFLRAAQQSFAVMVSLCAGTGLLVAVGYSNFTEQAVRFADSTTVFVLLCSVIAGFPNMALSLYLRAHKKEVLSVANASVAVGMLTLTATVAREPGLVGVSLVQLVGNAVLSAWVYWTFRRSRRQWHDL